MFNGLGELVGEYTIQIKSGFVLVVNLLGASSD